MEMETLSKKLVECLKEIVFDCNWQNVGPISQFKPLICYKFYSQDELNEDILIIRDKNNKFHAIDAKCSHEGGPLEQGDIEDMDEKLIIVCPWHHFDFDIETGLSSTGLQQQVFKTRVENETLYINTPLEISLKRPGHHHINETSLNEEKTEEIIIKQEGIKTNESHLSYWSVKILNTADPNEKANLTDLAAEKWSKGEMQMFGECQPPTEPKRLESLNVIDAAKIRRGKGGTLASRVALLHSLANIEQWAIDLSWDIIARFGSVQFQDGTKLPNQFFDDFIKVACDEAKHFRLLEKRLDELGSYFGALPVHNGLWQSASDTSFDLLSRLAIIHMVHEARGLDVHPQTRLRFENQKDWQTVELLDVLYKDEITHVAVGIKWFQFVCEKNGKDFIETFHSMVKMYFKSYLKPPFDTEGRTIAGMTEEWYKPLIKPTDLQKISDEA